VDGGTDCPHRRRRLSERQPLLPGDQACSSFSVNATRSPPSPVGVVAGGSRWNVPGESVNGGVRFDQTRPGTPRRRESSSLLARSDRARQTRRRATTLRNSGRFYTAQIRRKAAAVVRLATCTRPHRPSRRSGATHATIVGCLARFLGTTATTFTRLSYHHFQRERFTPGLDGAVYAMHAPPRPRKLNRPQNTRRPGSRAPTRRSVPRDCCRSSRGRRCPPARRRRRRPRPAAPSGRPG